MKFKSQQVATGAFLMDSHYMDPKEHFGHSYFFRSTSSFPTGARCQVPDQGKFDFKTRFLSPTFLNVAHHWIIRSLKLYPSHVQIFKIFQDFILTRISHSRGWSRGWSDHAREGSITLFGRKYWNVWYIDSVIEIYSRNYQNFLTHISHPVIEVDFPYINVSWATIKTLTPFRKKIGPLIQKYLIFTQDTDFQQLFHFHFHSICGSEHVRGWSF